MKNLINMLMAVTVAAFIFTGCAEDTCDTLVCKNGADCLDNTCNCPDGFRGKECEEVIDLCENVECEGVQTCDEGICSCPDGLEGLDCDIQSVEKFKAIWEATDTCSAPNQPNNMWQYDSEILGIETDQTVVTVKNFGGLSNDFSWTAEVSGDTIRVPLSDVPEEEFNTVEGEGIITEDRTTINWTYTVTYADNSSEDCIGRWLRR